MLLYRQILKPIWTYGAQLWSCTKKTNLDIIQKFQKQVLRDVVNAPWYIRNDNLHRDLGMEHVSEEIKKYAVKHKERLHCHERAEIRCLLDKTSIIRRLKRMKPIDLMS